MIRVFVLLSVAVLIPCIVCSALARDNKADLFELPIIHYNDFHARFEQTSFTSGTCSPADAAAKKCFGGFPRLFTAVKELMAGRQNAILLNAGDNFQGTLWYTVHKWPVMVEFMNKLPHDAMGLGNHEFDDKIAGVVPYLEQLNTPVLAANIDDSLEPTFQGKVKDSIIIQRGGRSIGIVGYILNTTNEISSSGLLKFTSEIEAVNRVATEFKNNGVDIIIALSHSGIYTDMDVAAACPDVDVIVGAHTHTLLYTGTPPNNDYAFSDYPLVVTQKSGRKVLIVQAQAYTKYIGNLTVFFDDNGEVQSWEGNAILLDNNYVQDPTMLVELEPYRREVAELAEEVVGSTLVFLDRSTCSGGECNMGNFITNAMVYEQTNRSVLGESWTYASIAATNSGGIRASIDETSQNGTITYGDLAITQPFQNTFDTIELQGKYILDTLEYSVSKTYDSRAGVRAFSGPAFLQWSGIRWKFNIDAPIGSRVLALDVSVLCNECRVPAYEPLDPEKYYRVVMNSFVVEGGDAHVIIRDNHRNREFGRLDTDILKDYLKAKSPVYEGLDGRTGLRSGAVSLLPTWIALLSTIVAFMNYKNV